MVKLKEWFGRKHAVICFVNKTFNFVEAHKTRAQSRMKDYSIQNCRKLNYKSLNSQNSILLLTLQVRSSLFYQQL